MMASDRAGYCNTVTRYNGEDLADDGPPVGCSYIQAFKRPIECYNWIGNMGRELATTLVSSEHPVILLRPYVETTELLKAKLRHAAKGIVARSF